MKIMDLTDSLSKNGYCCVLVIRKRTHAFNTSLSTGVKVIDYNLGESVLGLPKIILKSLMAVLSSRPSRILAFADHTASIFLLIKLLLFWRKIQVYVSEDIYLSEYLIDQRFGRIRGWLVKRLYPLADKILVLSPIHKIDLIDNFGIAKDKIVVYSNWLSPRWPKTGHSNFEKRDIDLLFVGRLEKQKRLGRFLKILAQLKATRPTVKGAVVGDGSLLNNLRQKAEWLGLKENLSFVGYRRNPMEFYDRAKVFLLTSRYEGQPLVFLEAMGAGVPIVTLPYKGLGGLMVEGKTGYVAKGTDSAVSTIDRLLSNKKEWIKVSHSAKEYLKNNFSENLERAIKILTVTTPASETVDNSSEKKKINHQVGRIPVKSAIKNENPTSKVKRKKRMEAKASNSQEVVSN